MERYSTLWGTEQAGSYGRLGSSKGLSSFLTQKIGAANVKDVVDLTEKLVTGIAILPGFEKEPMENKPMSVVYAPLYLQKNGMKGFCALGISGMEHREKRDSSYSHTYFYAREEMLDEKRYDFKEIIQSEAKLTYLDMLMGNRLTTYLDVARHRSGIQTVNFEQQPNKVEPILLQRDWAYVVAAIEALYKKKNVVFVLENGANFNSRSMALLTQFYSMLHPLMATETGFATYVPAKRILELSAGTNVQVYVVPGGAELNGLTAAKFEILNLDNPKGVERTPIAETLSQWASYDWKRRVCAMAHLFGRLEDYSNGELFVKLSREFFAQNQAFDVWYSDTSRHKTLTTIAQIQAEDKTDTDWKLVPWAKDLFKQKYPLLLKEGSVEILNARNVAMFYEYNGTDEELKRRSAGSVDQAAVQNAVMQYQYGRKLEGVSEAELSRAIWEKAGMRVTAGCQKEMDGLHKQIQDQAQTHQKELEAKTSEFETAWKNREEQHKTVVAGLNDQIVIKDTEWQQKMNDQTKQHQQTVEGLNTQLANKDSEWQKKMDDQTKQHQQAVDSLNVQLTNKDIAWQKKVSAEEQKTAAVQEQLNAAAGRVNALEQHLTNVNTQKKDLEGQLSAANAEKQNLSTKLFAANDEIAKQKKQHEAVGNRAKELERDNESKDKQISSLVSQLSQITGRAPVPTTMIGSVPVPNICFSLLAIITAVALVIGGVVGMLFGKNSVEPIELAQVQILAKNEAGETLDGTGFTIVDAEKNTVAQFATGTNVAAIFELELGVYTICNVDVPDGYVQAAELSANVTGEKGSNVFTVVIPAEPVPTASIQIDARDENGIALSGLHFEIIDADGTVVKQVTIDSVAGVEVSGLLLGEYTVHCVEVPSDYKLPEDVSVALTSEGEKKSCVVTVAAEPKIWNDDGTINWDCIQEQVIDIQTVELDPDAMAEMLDAKLPVPEGWEPKAMLLTREWTPNEKGVLPPYVLLLSRASVNEDGAVNEEVSAQELLDKGCAVLGQDEYCMLISAYSADYSNTWNKALKISVEIMDLLCGEDDQIATFSYMQEDGRVVDLHELMTAAELPENWWVDLDKLSFKNTDKNGIGQKIQLNSNRKVSVAIFMEDGTEGIVIDYARNKSKGDEQVASSKEAGRSSAHVDDFVLVMLNSMENTNTDSNN